MSVITPGHLFIHVPKTGGMWTTDALNCNFRTIRTPGHHIPLSSYSLDEIGERVTFSNVRSPWEWYGSWYQHSLDRKVPWLAEYGQGSVSFRDVLYGATHPRSVNPSVIGGYWVDASDADIKAWKRAGTGTCSFIHNFMCAPGVAVSIPTDRLHEGTLKLMGPGTRLMRQKINNRGLLYKDWYTAEMVRWVESADQEFIRRFDFAPFEPTPRPIYYSTQRSTLLSRLMGKLKLR